MLDANNIPAESPLLSDEMKAQLGGVFEKLQEPVVMKAVVNLECEKDRELASFLRVTETLSDKLHLELYGPEEAAKAVPELDTAYLPVTGLFREGSYGRVAFHGVPGGKEINSFVLAVCNLSGPGQEIGAGLKKKIEKLRKPASLKICVSLACHHCPQLVAACQRIAILNPLVTAEMIDAALYPQLVEQYHIERVPLLIVNDKDCYPGQKTIEEIVYLLK